MSKKILYLDTNAHLPLNKSGQEAFIEFNKSMAGHGHSVAMSNPGRLASGAIENSRKIIAELIGATSANQIIFTSSCTQACEWGINILKNQYKNDFSDNIYYNPIEHPAISDNCEDFIKLNIDKDGRILNETTYKDYVICTRVHNELGTIYNPSEIIRKVLLMDYSQALGKLKINVTAEQVDIAIFGAHKFGGPGGIGFLYLKDPSWWIPFGSGSRYFMDRPGTMDAAAIVATAAALKEANDTLNHRETNMLFFQNIVEKGLTSLGFEILGKSMNRIGGTTFVHTPGRSMEILLGLDKNQIYVGLGSACGALHTGVSRTIKELGREGTNHDYIRISQFGDYSTDDANYFINTLIKVLKTT